MMFSFKDNEDEILNKINCNLNLVLEGIPRWSMRIRRTPQARIQMMTATHRNNHCSRVKRLMGSHQPFQSGFLRTQSRFQITSLITLTRKLGVGAYGKVFEV